LRKLVLGLLITLLSTSVFAADKPQKIEHIIFISLDGLRPDAIQILGNEQAPTLNRLIAQGASTMNARTDPTCTWTMPNHAGMITGLPVEGNAGHGVRFNFNPLEDIHELNGRYVYSVFNILHNHGLKSIFFASKKKFQFFYKSYFRTIEEVYMSDMHNKETFEAFIKEFQKSKPGFSFLHIADPDETGHKTAWSVEDGSDYLLAVKRVDAYLGDIIQMIELDPQLSATTVVIVTADHGGDGEGHFDITHRENYTIPFIVWGAGVPQGRDLYFLNAKSRRNPKDKQMPMDAKWQPIRNSDAANLILSLFNLPPIPQSIVNYKQDLNVGF